MKDREPPDPGASAGPDSLVLYKSKPARVLSVAEKLEIELEQGRTQRVRPKDVSLLHPGPLRRLSELTARSGELEAAWELLAGQDTALAEVAELVFGEYTPATAWAAWELVADGLYFRGTPQRVQACQAQEVAREREARAARASEQAAWSAFLERARAGRVSEEDERYLDEVVRVAEGRIAHSRVLRELGHEQSPEGAHELLLRVGRWSPAHNPYPGRLRVMLEEPAAPLGELDEEPRADLTHLPAYAIDDEENQDPDDALSLEGDRLWVHVADVAALVPPASPADLQARERGASLYLPERMVPMLPAELTARLGLGLQPVSPALSFGITLDGEGAVADLRLTRSWVKVARLSYAQADERLSEEPFARMLELSERFGARRRAAGAIAIDLPEVSIRVREGRVLIRPLPRLRSRELVTNAMLMAGEAAARLAQEHGIPFPYSTQAPPEAGETGPGMAAMFAMRRRFQRSQMRSAPAPHAGLGLEMYSQSTSPLRRYLDLVVHQQLRAWLRSETPMDEEQMMARIGAADAVIGAVRRAERFSNRHWTLVYLLQNPDWSGEGVLVERKGKRGVLMVPELGMEAQAQLRGNPALDDRIGLRVTRVDLPSLSAYFKA